MQPLTVKSIWDGDGVARLQTLTIADYKSTTPLPQHTPLRQSNLTLQKGLERVGFEGEGGLKRGGEGLGWQKRKISDEREKGEKRRHIQYS